MKNLVSWQYIGGVFAIAAISLTGMLLVQQLASASGNSVEMEITQRNYDWGVSKPDGQDDEDWHRSKLDENFRVEASHQGDQMAFKVFVPGDWQIFAHTIPVFAGRHVSYDIENAFHKYVDSKEDCNNQRTDDSVQMAIGESYPLESDDAILPRERVKMVDMYADLSTMNEGRYSCLTVKLKGDVPRSPDTHPQWSFVSPEPITQTTGRQETSAASGDWPDISVVSNEETITAYSLAGASGLRFHFKYRILDKAGHCNSLAFAVAPNHPAVHRSNQFNRPDSPKLISYYRNRHVCFQAIIINVDSDAYARGASVYRYAEMRIGTTSPTIATLHYPRGVRGRSTSTETGIPDPIRVNSVWQSHIEEVLEYQFECGYWETENSEFQKCDDPADTQVIVQMRSDFFDCNFDEYRGLCEGYDYHEHYDLISRLACPEGWSKGRGMRGTAHLCYHPNHPEYIS